MKDNVIPFRKKMNQDQEMIEVFFSMGRNEQIVTVLLDKTALKVVVLLDTPTTEGIELDGNQTIGLYEFDSYEDAKKFAESLKDMSAIDLLILQHVAIRI